MKKFALNWFKNLKASSKNLVLGNSTNSVIIIPLYLKKIVLVEVRRPLFNSVFLELPRERAKVGEKTSATIKRALKEELGAISPLHIRHLGSILPESALLKNEVQIYTLSLSPTDFLAHAQKKSHHKNQEVKNLKAYPLNNILKLIQQGQIKDSLTIASIFIYQHSLKD